MQSTVDETFPWAEEIRQQLIDAGLMVSAEAVASLVAHAQAVLADNERLHLTSIREPRAFVERHVVESVLGAQLVDAAATGNMLDLGSGNGYPGVSMATVRPGLVPWLAETSAKKAAFLQGEVDRLGRGGVLHRQIQRASDLEDVTPLRLIVTRAMGGWQRIVPRLASCLAAEEAQVLVWAGAEMETIRQRKAWQRLTMVEFAPIPERESTGIWSFRASS